MIVALRIRTGGLGWRAYVDGYCGRVTLVLSADAADAGVAGAAAAGAGAWAGRAPADAHAPARASSKHNDCRMLVSSAWRYLTSSTTNGCPTNSVFSTRRTESVLTYIVNGTRAPLTSIRNPWNVPAGTVTATGAPTVNVSTLTT